jgi:hypothetical protein
VRITALFFYIISKMCLYYATKIQNFFIQKTIYRKIFLMRGFAHFVVLSDKVILRSTYLCSAICSIRSAAPGTISSERCNASGCGNGPAK